jgi:hypothetical protein
MSFGVPIPPPPAFDSIGGGTAFTGAHFTWTHTAATGAYVLCAINAYMGGAASTPTSVTYGSSAMTQIASLEFNTTTVVYLFLYALAVNPLSGSQTVTVTFPTPSATDGTGNTISYTRVASAGTPVTTSATSAALSQTVTCVPGQRIVQAFFPFFELANPPAGGTNRYYLIGDPGNSAGGLSIGDATATQNFTATATGVGGWGAAAIALTGLF